MSPQRLLGCALFGLWVQAATSQTVYRCGDQYTDLACPGGTAVPVQDARSAEQQAQARGNAQRERQTADALEKQRVQDEARAARAVPVNPAPTSAKPATPAAVKRAHRPRWKTRRPPSTRTLNPQHQQNDVAQPSQPTSRLTDKGTTASPPR